MGQKRVKGFGVGGGSVRVRKLISIDPDVWTAAKDLAKKSGRSVSRLIEDLLREETGVKSSSEVKIDLGIKKPEPENVMSGDDEARVLRWVDWLDGVGISWEWVNGDRKMFPMINQRGFSERQDLRAFLPDGSKNSFPLVMGDPALVEDIKDNLWDYLYEDSVAYLEERRLFGVEGFAEMDERETTLRQVVLWHLISRLERGLSGLVKSLEAEEAELQSALSQADDSTGEDDESYWNVPLGRVILETLALSKTWADSVGLKTIAIPAIPRDDGNYDALPILGWENQESPADEFALLPMSSLCTEEQLAELARKYPLSMASPIARRNAMGGAWVTMVRDRLEHFKIKGQNLNVHLSDDADIRLNQLTNLGIASWIKQGNNFAIAIGWGLRDSEKELINNQRNHRKKSGFAALLAG